jgi:hypothetical protein
METHIRKLFDLFDINKTGYLSLQEITGRIHLILFFFWFFSLNLFLELLELLQVNNSTELAQHLTNQNDKLNINGENI